MPGNFCLHAVGERLGAVAAVDRGQGALELDDLALAAELLAEELAGLGAVGPVVGADDHVDVALVGAGVDGDDRDLLRRELVPAWARSAPVSCGAMTIALAPWLVERLDVGDQLGDVVLRVGRRHRVDAARPWRTAGRTWCRSSRSRCRRGAGRRRSARFSHRVVPALGVADDDRRRRARRPRRWPGGPVVTASWRASSRLPSGAFQTGPSGKACGSGSRPAWWS